MTLPLKWQPVTALALFDETGRLLLQQRPIGKRLAGRWEFPGGKIEPGETPREALVREIAEELAIVVDPADLHPAHLAEEQGHPPIVLLLYVAQRWRGTPHGAEGQVWEWHTARAAALLDLAPMDRLLLGRLGGDLGEVT